MKKYRIVGRWLLGPRGFRRPAISGGGGGSGPKVLGSPQQNTTQTGDPWLTNMNAYAVPEVVNNSIIKGGVAGLAGPQPYMFTDYGQPGGPESQALGSLSNFYRGSTQDPFETQGISSMQSGLDTMRGAADPNAQIAAASDIFNRITAPSLAGTYTAAGQGRSGAMGEAMANAGAQMTLPILNASQQAQQAYGTAQNQFGGTLMNYGQLQRGRELDALQNLYGMSTMPRQEQAAANQPLNDFLLSMLGRFPVASGAGSSSSYQIIPKVSGGEPPVWQQVMGGLNSVAGIAGMAGMMCWVAAALYGAHDARFWCAWFQVNYGTPSVLGRVARKLYRRFGPTWAKSRVALFLLRPIFNRVARVGARTLGVEL